MANFLADMAPALSEMRQGLMGIAQLQRQERLAGLEEARFGESKRHTTEMERMVEERLHIEKTQEERASTKFAYEQEEIEKKKAWGKQLSPVLGIAPLIDQNPKTKQFLIDAVKGAGFEYKEENGVPLVQNDALSFIQNKFKTDLEFNKNVIEASKVDSAMRFQALYKQVNELRANGKEIKPEMMQQLKALGEEYASLENAKKEVDKEANRQAIRGEMDRLAQSGTWNALPNALKISANIALKTGDIAEFNQVLTEIAKEEVKPGRALTRPEILSGQRGTPEERRSLIEAEAEIRKKESTEKAGTNWILPDNRSVISYDGGRTYIDKNRQATPMPADAIKVPGGATLSEIAAERARKQAVEALEEPSHRPMLSPKDAALKGTGPYRRLASAFEAVAGGLGADLLIGKEGFFPQIADAKQFLRSVKQMGKAALMNSSRGAIWEQQRIDELFPDPDKTFTNPRIEARKFGNLIDVLSNEKRFNNLAIAESITPKEVEKYRASNNEIDRLISFVSNPKTISTLGGGRITEGEKSLIDKYLKRGK